MNTVFKLGNHCIAGISLTRLNALNTYSLLITLFVIHISIDFLNYGTRFGIGIGNDKIFCKVNAGLSIKIRA